MSAIGYPADARYRTQVTAGEIAEFSRRGFHIHEQLFSDEEVDAVIDHCERVTRGEYETGISPDCVTWRPGEDETRIRKIDNCWKADNTIAAMVLSPRLGEIAAQLIGAMSIRMWHDQLSYKPARGQVVTYHQDWAYWQSIAECKTVTCWIALDDVRPDSGPMVFLEGSHKYGLAPLPQGISGHDTQRPEHPFGKDLRQVPVIVKRGCVSFHHGLTLHGSEINATGYPRRAMVSHVISGECTFKPGAFHSNIVKMQEQPECPQPGERFAGPQFPLMYEAVG